MENLVEYLNALNRKLLHEYPEVRAFVLEVKEYDDKTDVDYRNSTRIPSTGMCWFVQQDIGNGLISIKSNHPNISEVAVDFYLDRIRMHIN